MSPHRFGLLFWFLIFLRQSSFQVKRRKMSGKTFPNDLASCLITDLLSFNEFIR